MSGIRRYVVWIAYDGSRFPEMAKGGTGMGVMDLFQQVLSHSLFHPRTCSLPDTAQFKFSPSSRTDAGVHALRSSVVLQLPESMRILEGNENEKESLLSEWNELSDLSVRGGLTFRDVHKVSAGFCIRRHVEYRRYTYRLAVRRQPVDQSLLLQPSLYCFSERNYAWLLPSGFNSEKAQEAAQLFEGVHCMASFFKHTAREKRLELDTPNTMKRMLRLYVDRGDYYEADNDLYDYYNVTVISRSFLREQIRRIVSCIVRYAYGTMKKDQILWLLRNPNSTHFHDMRVPISPPNGLFLTDVVYNANHFVHPIPYFKHGWDYDS